MKKTDLVVLFFATLLIFFLLFEPTRVPFFQITSRYPVISGFFKFFVFASFGDIISIRIQKKTWMLPRNILKKAIIWGMIGIVIVYIFGIYKNGVLALDLPFAFNQFSYALTVSVFMNLTFAPTMMAAHRISDTYLDNEYSLKETVRSIEWDRFVDFVVFKTIPFFWIPAHTITFLLPNEYQVLFAAILGIALGLLLGLFKK